MSILKVIELSLEGKSLSAYAPAHFLILPYSDTNFRFCMFKVNFPRSYIIDYLWSFSVTENGFAVKGENDMPLEQALKDNDRIHYFKGMTAAFMNAMHEDGVDIRSYFPWSMLSNHAPCVQISSIFRLP